MILWLAGLVTAVVAWGVVSARRMLLPVPRTLPLPDPPPVVRTLTLVSHDRTSFDVWAFEPAQPRGVILMCHGYRATWVQIAGVADGLRHQGYTALAINLRGHGGRPGPCTFGVRDRQDLEAVLAWRLTQPQLASLPVGMLGFSLGGAIACQMAAAHPEIRAVVLDSTFTRLYPIAARVVSMRHHLPEVPFAWITWLSVQLALRANLSSLDPLRLAGCISAPLLLIHGGQDQTVEPEQGEALFAAWRGPKERWNDPRAGHVGTYVLEPSGYVDRVAGFFDRWLLAP